MHGEVGGEEVTVKGETGSAGHHNDLKDVLANMAAEDAGLRMTGQSSGSQTQGDTGQN